VGTVLAPSLWLVIFLWIWAPLVSLARVSMGVHYLSDVIAGAILGVIVGLIGLQIYHPMVAWFTSFSSVLLW